MNMESNDFLEPIFKLSQAISRAAGLEEIYKIILEETCRVLNVERVSILKLDAQKNSLRVVAAKGIEPQLWPTIEIPVGAGISGQVFSSGEPILVEDIRGHQMPPSGGKYKTFSLMSAPVTCVPMQVGGRPLGVINVADRKDGRPFEEKDLRLLTTLAGQVASYLHLCSLSEEVAVAKKLEQQIEIARQVQDRLLPKAPIAFPHLETAATLLPAQRVGADYYDFVQEDGEGLCVAIADVSGHNIAGAMMAQAFRATFRASLQKNRSPARCVAAINRHLFQDLFDAEQFVSMVLIEFDHEGRRMTFNNAGHNPPLLFRAKTQKGEWLFTQDSLIGVEPNLKYHQRSKDLEKGDVVVLYTDGLTEAVGAGNERFGQARLQDIIAQSSSYPAPKILESLLNSFTTFTDAKPIEDDVTVIILKVRQ